MGGMDVDWKRLVFALACGKVDKCPFTEAAVRAGQRAVMRWAEAKGCRMTERADDIDQPVKVRLLQAFLRAAGDPDAPALDAFAQGVRLGVGFKMERTPAVFEERKKWRLDFVDDEPAEVWADNYMSAANEPEILAGKLQEAREAGRLVPFRYEEAKAEYGERLAVVACGLVQEGNDKWRLILDATHTVQINNRIRQVDFVPNPLVGDVATTMEEAEEDGNTFFGLTADYEGAHTVVKVDRRDWGLQACRDSSGDKEPMGADTELLLHNCGTFGFATAGMWWARLAAMFTRAQHYLLGPTWPLWILLVADDVFLLGRSAHLDKSLPLALFVVVLFGGPVKWAKCRGGLEFQWIGYWLDVARFRVGISEKRASWVISWLEALVQAGGADRKLFEAGLGRLGFVCGAVVFDRPFLAPLHTWAALKGGGCYRECPIFVKFILSFLAGRLRARRTIHCSRGRPRGGQAVERFRSDAKAEGDEIVIGGWEMRRACGEVVDTKRARWFQCVLSRTNAPWAYRRGEPFRVIAALELLGSLLSTLVFIGPKEKDGWLAGRVSAGLTTDNQGNRFVLNRMMTTKFPLLAFVCEFATVLEDRGCVLDLAWVPRDQNAEADAITNGDVGEFDPRRKVEVKLEDMRFNVLHELLDLGDKFYSEVEAAKAEERAGRSSQDARGGAGSRETGPQGPTPGGRGRKRQGGLKTTDPW